MSQPTHYELRVARFEDRRNKSRASNIYVKVGLEGVLQKTRISEKKSVPTWDDRLTFSSSDVSASFSIRVKEKSYKRLTSDVGDVNIPISKLLEECACGEAQLKVLSRPKKGTGSPVGDIYVYLKDVDAQERVGIDFENVRESVKRIDRSAYNADSAGNNIAFLVLQLDEVVKAVDAAVQINTYLNLTWQITSVLYKVVRHQLMVDQKLVELVKLMQETFGFASDVKSLSDKSQKLGQGFKDVLMLVNECCRFVQQYNELSFTERALKIKSNRKIDSFYERFCDVKKQIDSGVALHIAFQVDSIVTVQQLEALEKLLEPNKSDTSERPRCLAGTRTGYLEHIKSWILSDATSNILWLNGIAGCGKSTIAATIMDHCDDHGCLAAFLFFQRGKEEHKSIIRSIAYQLAAFHPLIARHIYAAAEQLRNITGARPARQFEKLLLEPLTAAEGALKGPTIIILDALDECGSAEQRREILELLRIKFSKFPLKVRFLVTSRPEDDIMTALSKGPIDTLKLDPASVDGRHDVDAYMDSAMRNAVTQPIPDSCDWEENMKTLKVVANGLFIWASTVVKIVSTSDDPVERLQDLAQDIPNGLDSLYATVLRQSGISWDMHASRDRFRKVLGLILFRRHALSDEVIDNFLGLPRGKARLTLQRLRSVLSYESGQPIRLYHASFADYLLSSDRCGGDPWFIDIDSERKSIATKCFDVMEKSLRFNICKLETSFVRNDEVEGLENRINTNIPQHLLYACRFWAEHVCQLQQTDDLAELLDKLKTFANQYLLYWFEVLSLTEDFGHIAIRALYETSLWTASIDVEVSSFLWAAYRLASVFSDPISQSTPHIYHSALSLWKGESRVANHYSTTHPVVPVQYIGKKSREPCIKILHGHIDGVKSVAFSPDGKSMVSGSRDKTIRIWDMDTGELVSDPFTGHTRSVNSVAYSPDGKRAVSGSDDGTIRVWDANTGELMTFTGHTRSVNSVAYSPDGKRVVSGSDDHTIRIWDADTGELVSGPFTGHGAWVRSVAFSPDGKRVVSGSDDETIRIWDTDTGKLVSDMFTGDRSRVYSFTFPPGSKLAQVRDANTGKRVWGAFASGVYSVAFSPDGKRVVSGSFDETIRIWDADTGQLVSGPFTGHTDSVCSVAFSPDGKRVVSGSDDETIRIWDANTGELVSGPFTGHAASVLSVAFSPDGKRVISGSFDRTIRSWDIDTGEFASGPFTGHAGRVYSVAFSPDGKRVASGSDDKTIRIWDADTGDLVSAPFTGHAGKVFSVAFSPDGKRVASGSLDETIRIWDIGTGEPVFDPLTGHTGNIWSVAFSPDGKLVASGSYDETILIWDANTGKCVSGPFKGHTASVCSVAFSPDGKRVVSGSGYRTIRIWDIDTGKCVSGPFKGHTASVFSVAFSPDGKRVVSGSDDKTIRIWDADTGQLVSGPFTGHTDSVCSVAFSPDGKRVVSGSEDETVRIWDANSGELLSGPFTGHTLSVKSVAFSPDGKRVVSSSNDKTIRIWDSRKDIVLSTHAENHQPSTTRASPSSSVLSRTSAGSSEQDVGLPDFGGCDVDPALSKGRSFSNWTMSDDGWLLGERGELLMWIPEDMRKNLWRSENTAVFSIPYSVKVDFTDYPLGENWCKGFPKSK